MDRFSERPRPSRRAFVLGSLASVALSAPSRAFENQGTVLAIKAEQLLNNLAYAEQSLAKSDAEMLVLLKQCDRPNPLVDATMRSRVAQFARYRLQRNAAERKLIANLAFLKSVNAFHTMQEALRVVATIENDALNANRLALLARVDEFKRRMGVTGIS
jgi:hypothetical protein